MRLGAWLRSGDVIGWIAADTIYRMPFSYFFFWRVCCVNCSFLFVVFVLILFCFVLMLSLELCRCSSDLFPAQQATHGIGNHVYYWVCLRPDRVNVKKTYQHFVCIAHVHYLGTKVAHGLLADTPVILLQRLLKKSGAHYLVHGVT